VGPTAAIATFPGGGGGSDRCRRQGNGGEVVAGAKWFKRVDENMGWKERSERAKFIAGEKRNYCELSIQSRGHIM
jgi:hypothetical protein